VDQGQQAVDPVEELTRALNGSARPAGQAPLGPRPRRRRAARSRAASLPWIKASKLSTQSKN
jgi:hypothetical protein